MRSIATITSISACVVAVLVTGGCKPVSGPGPTSATGSPSQVWVMPNLVGKGLQDAQDQIQELTSGTLYFTDSHDLSGQGRHQALDANWQVCTQNVAPGAALDPTSKIDFGVVKLDETCP